MHVCNMYIHSCMLANMYMYNQQVYTSHLFLQKRETEN